MRKNFFFLSHVPFYSELYTLLCKCALLCDGEVYSFVCVGGFVYFLVFYGTCFFIVVIHDCTTGVLYCTYYYGLMDVCNIYCYFVRQSYPHWGGFLIL